MDTKILGSIKVIDVKDNPDGTATITFDISDEVKENLKRALKWKRWSQKRFETYIQNSLMDLVKELEAKHGIGQP